MDGVAGWHGVGKQALPLSGWHRTCDSLDWLLSHCGMQPAVQIELVTAVVPLG